jgi:hypothetical protein
MYNRLANFDRWLSSWKSDWMRNWPKLRIKKPHSCTLGSTSLVNFSVNVLAAPSVVPLAAQQDYREARREKKNETTN